MTTTPNSKNFPQFSAAGHADRPAGGRTLQDHRVSPSVLNVPGSVISWKQDGQSILLCLESLGERAVLSYTHETSLHLRQNTQPSRSRLWLKLHIWGEEIFRITFSADPDPKDPFAGLPVQMHMLTGSPSETHFTLAEEDSAIVITTGKLRIRINKSNGAISAWDNQGCLRYSQCRVDFQTNDIRGLALSDLDGGTACFEALELDNDELIYGLGERFDGMVRNGRNVDFHNKDAVGTTSPRTYVNIPFYISTKGYGLFLNSGAATDWQIGTRDASALQFGVLEDRLDYFVIASGDPKSILRGYCGLTGFAPLPPLWSFGLWLSRNSYVSWDVVNDVATKVRSHDIPCDVLHLDTAWFGRDWNCDLKFSQERFPDPVANMARLKEEGFHISLWQYNFIPPNADNTHYHEAVAGGYLSKKEDGSPYQLPDSCQGSWTKDVTIDFSNPEARKWYGDKIRGLIAMGAGAIKTDFGEGIAEDAIYHSIDGSQFHNLYSLVYNHVVFHATKDASGENIVWARSGTAGSQRYPLHWGGDSQCSFEALAGTLRAALSIGMCGIPFFSHDIGGFLGTPDDELYVRWAQLGLFSSHARCHGVGDENYREPWRFGSEACRIFRYYDKLRYSLMPYIYAEAEKCTRTGLPMMRALILEYPDDRNVRHIDDEYLFGENLLIAPVLKPLARSRVRDVYLPEGVWFDYFTKERIESRGMWIRREVDLETMPIYVKEGSELRYCAENSHLCNGMGEIIRTEHWA